MSSKYDNDYNIDIHSLIQFDILKKVIEKFFKNQKNLENQIFSLQTQTSKNNIETIKKINRLQKVINSQPDVSQKNSKNKTLISEFKDNIPKEEIKKKNTFEIESTSSPIKTRNINSENFQQHVSQPDPMLFKNSRDSILNEEILNNLESFGDLITKLSNRVTSAEESIMKIFSEMKREVPEIKSLPENELTSENYSSFPEQDKETSKKINELIRDVHSLKEKFKELDIFNLFKSDSGSSGDEKSKKLLNSMQGKITDKFNYIDEKLKSIDKDIIKSKNDISNNKILAETSQRVVNTLKESYTNFLSENVVKLEEIRRKTAEINDNTKNELTKLIEESNSKNEEILEDHSKKLKKLVGTQNLKQMVESSEITSGRLNGLFDEFKLLMNKAITDSERSIKSFVNDFNIEIIRRDVFSLKKNIQSKIEKKDLQDLYLKCDEMSTQLAGDRDQIDQIKADIRILSDSNIKSIKKVEYFSGILNTMKPSNYEVEKMKKPEVDYSQFVTKPQLNQAVINFNSEVKQLNKADDEIREYIEQLGKSLAQFASEGDLKNMEQCILNELEEYKIAALKKFGDKLEIQKNLRYIDMQIKHLIETFTTKDGGDNWLIAKKGMYHCASCDSFIGELKDKSEFLPWNKIQPREENNSNKYRMGHGFSRMLQMINVDILKSAEAIKDSPQPEPDKENVLAEDSDRKDILPKISHATTSRDLSCEAAAGEVVEERKQQGPKVVKVYKRLKSLTEQKK